MKNGEGSTPPPPKADSGKRFAFYRIICDPLKNKKAAPKLERPLTKKKTTGISECQFFLF